MAAATAASGPALISGHHGPAIVAHGAGNTPSLVREAIAVAADYVEVDLWVHRGRFEARHERAAYPLPLLFEKWYLRWAPRHRFGLADLISEAAGRVGLFLDLKGGGAEAAALIRRALDEAGTRPSMVASAQQWETLRAVHRAVPEVDLFYSVDVATKLNLFLSVSQRDDAPRGVSCRHDLLSAEAVTELHDRGLLVAAWTVDEPARAEELAAWGVDAITTHRVGAVRRQLGLMP
jgi:glycerophosphoryl diester phosphodiesterase